MAEVWVARRRLGKKGTKFVAVKLLADHYVGEERYSRMFRSEAELAAILSHANIVQVFDEGEHDGRSYLVMEWVDGLNLLKLGAVLGLIDDDDRRFRVTAYIIGQLLYALSYAHSITSFDGSPLGVVHRDVSPQNVLVSNHGEVKLTDFGVAYHVMEESSGIHVKGKVRYMAPEQLGGNTRSPTVDLFAVGALLHELIDGKKFRHGYEDGQDMFARVLSGEVPPLSRTIPPALDELRLQLLQPDPAARIQTAEDAIIMLKRYDRYGDARSELTKLCGSLTGVVRPRAGPGQSSQVAMADLRTTPFKGRKALAKPRVNAGAPPPKLPPPPPAYGSAGPSLGATTQPKAPVAAAPRVPSPPVITGQTQFVRPQQLGGLASKRAFDEGSPTNVAVAIPRDRLNRNPRGVPQHASNSAPAPQHSTPIPVGVPQQSSNPIPVGVPQQSSNPIPVGVPQQSSNPIPVGVPQQPSNPVPVGVPQQPSNPIPVGVPQQSSNPIPVGVPQQPANPIGVDGAQPTPYGRPPAAQHLAPRHPNGSAGRGGAPLASTERLDMSERPVRQAAPPGATEVFDATMFADSTSGSGTDHDLMPHVVARDGTDTSRDIPPQSPSQSHPVVVAGRSRASTAVTIVAGLFMVALLSVGATWMLFRVTKDDPIEALEKPTPAQRTEAAAPREFPEPADDEDDEDQLVFERDDQPEPEEQPGGNADGATEPVDEPPSASAVDPTAEDGPTLPGDTASGDAAPGQTASGDAPLGKAAPGDAPPGEGSSPSEPEPDAPQDPAGAGDIADPPVDPEPPKPKPKAKATVQFRAVRGMEGAQVRIGSKSFTIPATRSLDRRVQAGKVKLSWRPKPSGPWKAAPSTKLRPGKSVTLLLTPTRLKVLP